MLDNNPGFELEGIHDCHMYIVHFVHYTIQFSYLVKLFYISVFGSAFVAFNNFKYVYSAINERE